MWFDWLFINSNNDLQRPLDKIYRNEPKRKSGVWSVILIWVVLLGIGYAMYLQYKCHEVTGSWRLCRYYGASEIEKINKHLVREGKKAPPVAVEDKN